MRADLKGGAVFPPGVIRLARNVTLTAPASAAAGARIRLDTGVTLSLEGGFSAPRRQVFEPGARIDFGKLGETVGLPEWWGARRGDAAFDCAPAIAEAVRACRVVSLAPGDYWLGSTLVLETPHRRIVGAGKLWAGEGTATRLVVTSAELDGVRIGPVTSPGGGPNNFLQDVRLEGVSVWRGAGLLPASGAVGVRLQYCVNCRVEDVASVEHAVAFSLAGCVYTRLRDCRAFRSEMGREPGGSFVGLLIDEAPEIGLAGGSASIYVEDCTVTTGGEPRLSRSVGVSCPGGFTDLFFTRLETAFLDRAFELRANPRNSASTQDLHLVNCILDSCAIEGVVIEGDAAGADFRANVNILGGYIAGTGPRFAAGVHLRNLTGCVSVTNTEILGDGTAGAGILCERVNGLVTQGNMISDCYRPLVLRDVMNCRFADVINTSRAADGGAAIQLERSRRNVIACILRGQDQTFGAGVSLSGGCAFNEIACSGIDPACVRGGAAAKVVSEGRAVTSPGPFGDGNLASGIMA